MIFGALNLSLMMRINAVDDELSWNDLISEMDINAVHLSIYAS